MSIINFYQLSAIYILSWWIYLLSTYLSSTIFLFVCPSACLSAIYLSLPLWESSPPLYEEPWRVSLTKPANIGNLKSCSHPLKLGEITFCCLRQSIYAVNSMWSACSVPNWWKSLWSNPDFCIFNKTPNNIHMRILHYTLSYMCLYPFL